jgi:hypothetical protein
MNKDKTGRCMRRYKERAWKRQQQLPHNLLRLRKPVLRNRLVVAGVAAVVATTTTTTIMDVL